MAGRADVRVIPVANEFFGGNTGVTGLMTGADLSRVLGAEPAGHRYLLPDVCLSDDGRFLDGGTVADLPQPVEVVATDGHALRRCLGEGVVMGVTCPPSSSSDGPTSASRRCSTASSASRRRSSRTAPASPATARSLDAEWLGVPFRAIDTGGWMPGGSDLEAKVSRQVEAAVRSADVVLFVVDAAAGMTDDDESIAVWLRRIKAPVLLVVNKSDNDRRENDRWEFLALGLDDPLPVSALHDRHAGDLLDEVVARFPGSARSADEGDVADSELDRDVPWAPGDQPPPRRHRRAPQRRQEHAVQPVGGGGSPSSTTWPAPPRLDRHARGDTGRADRLRRHGGHAPAQPDRRFRRVLLDRPRPCGRSTVPTSRCWSSTPPRASPPRTSAWPSGSMPPAARSS